MKKISLMFILAVFAASIGFSADALSYDSAKHQLTLTNREISAENYQSVLRAVNEDIKVLFDQLARENELNKKLADAYPSAKKSAEAGDEGAEAVFNFIVKSLEESSIRLTKYTDAYDAAISAKSAFVDGKLVIVPGSIASIDTSGMDPLARARQMRINAQDRLNPPKTKK